MFDLLGRVLLKCSSGEAEKLQAKHHILGYSAGIVITKETMEPNNIVLLGALLFNGCIHLFLLLNVICASVPTEGTHTLKSKLCCLDLCELWQQNSKHCT